MGDRRRSTSGESGAYVTCSIHQVTRKAVYCERVPVFDADQKIVDYIHRCKNEDQCTVKGMPSARGTGSEGAGPFSGSTTLDCSSSVIKANGPTGGVMGQSAASNAATATNHSSGEVVVVAGGRIAPMGISFFTKNSSAETDTEGSGHAEKTGDGNDTGLGKDNNNNATNQTSSRAGGNRYYEMLEKGANSGSAGGLRKVCWNCGLTGHEKPDCTNMLCRTCHSPKAGFNQPHSCAPVPDSAFIVAMRTLPANVPHGMVDVRCVYCGERGHFDCAPLRPQCHPAELSCCYCASSGHTSFDCHLRETQNGDRYVQRMRSRSSASHGSYHFHPYPPQQGHYSEQHYNSRGQHENQYYSHSQGYSGYNNNNSNNNMNYPRSGSGTRQGGRHDYNSDSNASWGNNNHNYTKQNSSRDGGSYNRGPSSSSSFSNNRERNYNRDGSGRRRDRWDDQNSRDRHEDYPADRHHRHQRESPYHNRATRDDRDIHDGKRRRTEGEDRRPHNGGGNDSFRTRSQHSSNRNNNNNNRRAGRRDASDDLY